MVRGVRGADRHGDAIKDQAFSQDSGHFQAEFFATFLLIISEAFREIAMLVGNDNTYN